MTTLTRRPIASQENPDLTDAFVRNLGARPIFVAALTPDCDDCPPLSGGYDLVPAGPIFEVRRRD